MSIYNAFDPEWGENNFEVPSELEGKQYILNYGRIVDSIKDISFLMESFTLSNLWKKNIYLVILGDGEDKEDLKVKASKLPSSNHIIFLPFTETPFPYVKHAKFVTLNSKYEGFPMVLVESLSLGTPVVSLDIISGPSEIIEHEINGLLVENRDSTLFSDAIKTMCMNETLYHKCKENTIPSVKKFSMDEISKQWNKLLINELQ